MSDPVEGYLSELERTLPRAHKLRNRILAETEDHLRETAQKLGPELAIERFGAPRELARQFVPAYARFYARLSAWATLVVVTGFVALLYPIPENVLPPAPWPEGGKPDYLAWKQHAVAALFLVAVGAWAVAVATPRRHVSVSIFATLAALGSLVAAAVLGAVVSFQWAEAVPGTPGWLAWLSLGAIVPIVLAATPLARARLAQRQLRGD